MTEAEQRDLKIRAGAASNPGPFVCRRDITKRADKPRKYDQKVEEGWYEDMGQSRQREQAEHAPEFPAVQEFRFGASIQASDGDAGTGRDDRHRHCRTDHHRHG
jgi:hypothetical protein